MGDVVDRVVATDEILDAPGDRRVTVVGTHVVDYETEYGDGNPTAVGIGRNQRIECLQPNPQGQRRVGKHDLGKRVRGVECGVAKPGWAGVRLRHAMSSREGCQEGPFEASGKRFLTGFLTADGKKRVIGIEPLGGAIRHFPITEIAAPAQ